MRAKKVEISHRTIIFTVAFLAFLWLVYYIRDVILQIFVALLIMTILNPTVSKFNKKLKIPRVASVLIVYLFVFGFISFGMAVAIPPFAEQTTSFANNIPAYIEELSIPDFIANGLTQELASLLGNLPSQIIRLSVSIFSNVLSVFSVFIFALYFLLARENLNTQLAEVFNDKTIEQKIERTINKLELKLGGWARGQIILMTMVGLLTYIGLSLIGIPYALPLALLAGILEIIPNIGPFLSAIPAVVVGFGISPLTGIAVAALGILIQQVENYVFVPKVMQKSAGISPIITLLSLLIGFKVAGIVGAILSVPVVITTKVIVEEFFSLDFMHKQ